MNLEPDIREQLIAGTAMLLAMLAMTTAVIFLVGAGCAAIDTRSDCRVLVEKLREATPAELMSVAQVYRANGCADQRKTPEMHEWVKR